MKPRLVAFVTIVMLTGMLGGCTAARNGLGTRDSACFRVYPEARAAVHGHGRFAGERYLPPRADHRAARRRRPHRAEGPRPEWPLALSLSRAVSRRRTSKRAGRRPGPRAGSLSSSFVSTTSSSWPQWSSVGSRRGWSLPACSPGCDRSSADSARLQLAESGPGPSSAASSTSTERVAAPGSRTRSSCSMAPASAKSPDASSTSSTRDGGPVTWHRAT